MSAKTGKFSITSATLRGVEALKVNVEVSVSAGMPSVSVVGMPDVSIKESKERIRSAIKSCGFKMPQNRIVANLAPSSIKKSGSGFDLPIAVGILAATNQIPVNNIEKMLIVGELSLDGSVSGVPGMLAHAICARDEGLVLLSGISSDQTVDVKGVEQKTILNLRDFLTQNFTPAEFVDNCTDNIVGLDFKDIAGHDQAKRALSIAACGNHGVFMVGPPGSGKTLLSSRLPSILPPLTETEKMETAVVHSIAGNDVTPILNGIRPFRSPHHSATLPGLIGGGQPTRPGEVSLAHNGVLYLDELAEFSNHVLQGIRQPMESGNVSIIRADGRLVFPAKFSLIASSNPCPCGYYGDSDHECRCTPYQVMQYQTKIGGPILDRIDMHLDVCRINPVSVLETGKGKSSYDLFCDVQKGIEFKEWRKEKKYKEDIYQSSMGSMQKLIASCQLDQSELDFLTKTCNLHNMSGRGIIRVLSVARTIADMSCSNKVSRAHLSEALTYRVREKSEEVI